MLTREQVAGCRATIKTDPKPNRRWRESIFVSALDSIDFLEGKLSSCESCLAEAEREVERLKEENSYVMALHKAAYWSCDDKEEADINRVLHEWTIGDIGVKELKERFQQHRVSYRDQMMAAIEEDRLKLLNSEGRAGA